MKRYRWTSFYLDSERAVLQDENLPDSVKLSWVHSAKASIAARYGAHATDEKFERWLSLEVPSICAPVEYLDLLHEAEDSFILGAFYPALTAACCLGERILNHLVIQIRTHKTSNPRYKEVWRRNSVDDWTLAIGILSDWAVLSPQQSAEFSELLELRNPAVHFGSIEERAEKSRRAVELVFSITASLFGQSHERFFWCPGEIYVKKSYETDPVTIEFVLPHCIRVGYEHEIKNVEVESRIQLMASDPSNYVGGEITDEEFRERRENFNQTKR